MHGKAATPPWTVEQLLGDAESPFAGEVVAQELHTEFSAKRPLVSFVVPVHDQEECIAANLACLAGHAVEDFELIVILDGCRDDSRGRVLDWAGSVRLPNAVAITVLSTSASIYETASDAVGIALAKGVFIIEVQADMRLEHPGFDRAMVSALQENRGVFAVSGRGIHPRYLVWSDTTATFVRVLRGGARILAEGHRLLTTTAWRRYRPSRLVFRLTGQGGRLGASMDYPVSPDSSGRLFVGGSVIRGPLAFRRESYLQLGGFDTRRFFLGNDDHDLLRRAERDLNQTGAYLPIRFSSPLRQGSTRKPRSATDQARHEYLTNLFDKRQKDSTWDILIVQADHDGHRLGYVALLVRAALDEGLRVHLALGAGALGSAEYQNHLARHAETLGIQELSEPSISAIENLARELGASDVVVPESDLLLVPMVRRLLRGRLRQRWHLLLMRTVPEASTRSRVRIAVKRLLAAIANRAPSVDVFYLVSSLDPGSHAKSIPDPTDVHATAGDGEAFRDRHGMDGGRFWFSITGSIYERKNPLLVLRALASVSSPGTVGLLLAGQIEPRLRSELDDAVRTLESMDLRVVVVDRHLSDQEFDAAIRSSDCSVLAYSNEGPSGILGKSVALGVRVVAAGAESLRQDCAQAPESTVWAPLERSSLTEAFEQVQSLGGSRDDGSRAARQAGGGEFARRLLGLDRRPRVLQFLLSDRVGGAESMSRTLGEGLASKGFHVSTAYLDDPEAAGGRLHRLLRTRRTIRDLKPDVIIAHTYLPALYARMVPGRARVFCVLHSATDDFAGRASRMIERVLRRRAVRIVAVSRQQLEQYGTWFGDRVPLSLIPNGVNAPSSARVPKQRVERIVTLSRVTQQKNPKLWVSVAEQVSKDESLDFVWYGPVDDDPETRRLVAEAAKNPRIHFEGPSSDVWQSLAQADLLFHPSDREAHSLTLLEAAVAGVPIVCADEVAVNHGPNFHAELFGRGRAGSAVEAITRSISNYGDLSVKASARAGALADEFGSARMVDEYARLLRESLGDE